ncbi:MAG TPA: hypothetical protein PKK95_09230 [Vicinamibacterales bacterium]|nr:hypothetical protein [Vicinamibacterales bacterium]
MRLSGSIAIEGMGDLKKRLDNLGARKLKHTLIVGAVAGLQIVNVEAARLAEAEEPEYMLWRTKAYSDTLRKRPRGRILSSSFVSTTVQAKVRLKTYGAAMETGGTYRTRVRTHERRAPRPRRFAREPGLHGEPAGRELAMRTARITIRSYRRRQVQQARHYLERGFERGRPKVQGVMERALAIALREDRVPRVAELMPGMA